MKEDWAKGTLYYFYVYHCNFKLMDVNSVTLIIVVYVYQFFLLVSKEFGGEHKRKKNWYMIKRNKFGIKSSSSCTSECIYTRSVNEATL